MFVLGESFFNCGLRQSGKACHCILLVHLLSFSRVARIKKTKKCLEAVPYLWACAVKRSQNAVKKILG
jgi:hypothetical protein